MSLFAESRSKVLVVLKKKCHLSKKQADIKEKAMINELFFSRANITDKRYIDTEYAACCPHKLHLQLLAGWELNSVHHETFACHNLGTGNHEVSGRLVHGT